MLLNNLIIVDIVSLMSRPGFDSKKLDIGGCCITYAGLAMLLNNLIMVDVVSLMFWPNNVSK